MGEIGEIQTFVNDVSHAANEHHFVKAANALSDALGYRWFAYIRIVQGCAELLSTYPTFWTDHYFASGFEAVDPVVTVSKTGCTPFLWGADERVCPTDQASLRLFDDASFFGIRFGVTIPVCRPSGQIAAFTLSTDERPTPSKRQEGILIQLQECGCSFHAHATARLTRFMAKPSTHSLTVRQQACLSAVAEGHSAKETARLINLTPRTVEYHLEAAKRRLHAESLPHAVALALRGNMIS